MTTVLSTIPSTPETPAAEAPATPETPAAEPPAAPASSAEPVKLEPEKPDPDLEIARKLDMVTRREAKARRQEAEIQKRLADADAKLAALSAKEKELEEALDDPITHYLKKGKDPVEVAKRFAKPVSEEEKELRALKERLDKQDAEAAKRIEAAEKRSKEERRAGAVRQFAQATDPEEYPHLTAVYRPAQLPGLIDGLLHRPQDPTDPESPSVLEAFESKYGRRPTDKEIRDALEHEAELHAMSLIERLPKRRVDPSQVTPPTPTATPPGEESTSLSNQHAASSPSGLSRIKSREERMKELKAELEAEAATTD